MKTEPKKKTIIVTGASGNLGQATVRKFAADGYRVIAIVSAGKQLNYPVEGDVTTHALDVTNEANVALFTREVLSPYPAIDAAILLVGGFTAGRISDTDGAMLKKMFALNFESAFYLSTNIFQKMIGQPGGGRIVLVGSRTALEPARAKTSFAYSLSKSVLFNLAGYQNAEGNAKNVVTSVVVPGTIDTPDNRKFDPNANFADWVKPEEIAEAISFLCDERSKSLKDPILKMYGKGS